MAKTNEKEIKNVENNEEVKEVKEEIKTEAEKPVEKPEDTPAEPEKKENFLVKAWHKIEKPVKTAGKIVGVIAAVGTGVVVGKKLGEMQAFDKYCDNNGGEKLLEDSAGSEETAGSEEES